MAAGRQAHDWDQTAWITAAVVNGHFGRKHPVKPADVNPYTVSRRPEIVTEDPGVLFDGLF